LGDNFLPNILAIANQKGGVGKSTLSLNFGGVLAEKGKRTLLVDMDQQGNLSSVFIEKVYSLELTIANLLLSNENSVSDVIQSTNITNLFILPANLDLSELDTRLAGDYDAQYLLSEIIETPDLQDFDFILIDCPPNLSIATRMAMIAAQRVIVPMEAQEWAVQGSKRILAYIDKVKKRVNPELVFSGFVINKMKNRNIERAYRDHLRDAYPGKVFKTELRDNVQYVEATTEKKPINFYLPRSDQAEAFRSLVREIFDA
jgi:chromosome partitioning protein